MTAPENDESPRPSSDLGFELPPPAKMTHTRAVALFALAVVVFGGAFVVGWMPRHKAKAALAEDAKSGNGLLRVEVIAPKPVNSDRAIALPGTIQPLEETTLYARANGYVRKWMFDLGDVVKEGDVLADIDTPETDRELAQARAEAMRAAASVVQAKATSDKADKDLARAEELAKQGLLSAQDLDQKKADAAVGKANVKVAEAAAAAQSANVARLQQLRSYSQIVAPFAGTITMRTIERGALVTAGTGTPLYKLAATDTVRVLLSIPQNIAPSVKLGMPAKITVREFAGKTFEGKVAHSATALDPATRTMLTEIRVPNAEHTLLAGMFVNVALSLPTPHKVVEIPSTALLTDAKGVRVATVDGSGKIHLVPIVIERDTGPTIEVASGLEGSEKVVKLASAELTEGRPIELATK